MWDEILAEQMERFMNKLNISREERKQIEEMTRNQGNSDMWREERYKGLTASNFGKICKLRPSTSCANTVKNLLYNSFQENIATKWGKDHEEDAVLESQNHTNLKVMKCGLFIDETYPFLGASPDGLVENDSLLEVKWPFSCSKLIPEEGLMQKKLKFVSLVDGNLKLKKTYDYYYQVQVQLNITQRIFCYFVI